MWDALRGVPGVDVFTTRAADGIVRIRGLAKANTNRTLILLNGRWILDGFIESLNWESLPITLEEVDRIEVVGGASRGVVWQQCDQRRHQYYHPDTRVGRWPDGDTDGRHE